MAQSRWNASLLPRSVAASLCAAVLLLVTAAGTHAGIEPSPFKGAPVVAGKPLSLVASPVTRNGVSFVPLSMLARALGGTGVFNEARRIYEITPGAGGVLKVNPGALAAFASASRQGHRLGQPNSGGGNKPGEGIVAGQNQLLLRIGGQDVMIDNYEFVLLRPADPGASVPFLARMLGGQAKFDAASKMWKLPPGDTGSPLAFR